MHTSTYIYPDPSGQMTIDSVSWEILHLEPTLEELRVYLKHKHLELVIGSGFIGNFVYIPSLGFGFTTDDLDDAEHNRCHLTEVFSHDDACAVASVLRQYVKRADPVD